MTSFGVWGLPQMIHKYYAIKDEEAIKKGNIISTLFELVIGGSAYFTGSLGRLFFIFIKVIYLKFLVKKKVFKLSAWLYIFKEIEG